jgi:hypothetical protein
LAKIGFYSLFIYFEVKIEDKTQHYKKVCDAGYLPEQRVIGNAAWQRLPDTPLAVGIPVEG